MTNNIIWLLGIFFAFSFSIPIYLEIREVSKKVDDLLDKPKYNNDEPAITMGLYRPANENATSESTNTGLVVPKTPQLIEFEEQEELRKLNLRPR